MRVATLLVVTGLSSAACTDEELSSDPWAQAGAGAAATGSGQPPGVGGGGDAGTGGAQEGVPVYDGVANAVMMQGFYWNAPSSAAAPWWKRLADLAPELASAGIDAIWIPPPYKGKSGTNDVGYGVYDRWDLGEFDQKGTVATRYGSRAQLEAAIAALHDAGVRVYADVVMNHMMGGDEDETFTVDGTSYTANTRYTYPGRNGTYSPFVWTHEHFNGCKQGSGWVQWHPWDFAPYSGGDAWDNLLGCEIRYADEATRSEMITWGKWLTTELALDGYRLDATKHMLTSFVNEWLDAVKGPRFAVSESWMADVDRLVEYAEMTGGRTALFDVPLHYLLYEMSEGDGAWDMRGLAHAGFVETHGPLAVTFVDNHDTDTDGGLHSPVQNFKLHAYAYVLLRAQGYPCVFYKDWFEYGWAEPIRRLIELRDQHAGGEGIEHAESDEDVYVYSRRGDTAHSGLVLVLNDGAAGIKVVSTPFPGATLEDATGNHRETVVADASGQAELPVAERSYAVWVPR